MRLLWLCYLLLIAQTAAAQQGVVVVEKNNKAPIPGALVEWKNHKRAAITDRNGKAFIPINKSGYTIRSVGFETIETLVLSDTVFMVEALYSLPTVAISNKPDSIFGHKNYHIADFLFWDNKLTLLLYEHEKYFKKVSDSRELWEGAWIAQLNEKGKIIFSFYIGEPAERLHASPTGECYVLTENHVFQILCDGERGLKEVNSSVFREQIMPICGYIDKCLVFQTFTKDYPEFEYYFLSPSSKEPTLIEHVADSITLELFKSQYKYLPGYKKKEALQTELDTGVPKEIVAGYMTGFQHDLYYHDPIAFIAQGMNHWRIFNFSQRRDIQFEITGESHVSILNSDLIELCRKNKLMHVSWSESGVYFIVQGRGGITYLYELENNGKLSKIKEIYWNYAKSFQINGNKIYYLYRPFESAQSWYLYSEKIR
ncbi:MAG: hypothetical protein ACKO8Q_03405 [Bacteroidota bacterium]